MFSPPPHCEFTQGPEAPQSPDWGVNPHMTGETNCARAPQAAKSGALNPCQCSFLLKAQGAWPNIA